MFNRQCCEFICNSPEVKKFEDYYLNTLIADESFFQTVLMNTSFKGTIVNDDKRAIIWIPDGDIKLRPKTFTQQDLEFLLESDCFFARKFDDREDNTIIDSIDLTLLHEVSAISSIAHKNFIPEKSIAASSGRK